MVLCWSSMQWHICVQIGLHWLQSGTDVKWKSIPAQSFGGAGTGQHHPATVETQQYSRCPLRLIKCQIWDGTCHSFLDDPSKRKGCIWCIVKNVRWEISREESKVFINCFGLQAWCSTSSVDFAGRNQMLKACKQQGHLVLLCDCFRVCGFHKPGWESLL